VARRFSFERPRQTGEKHDLLPIIKTLPIRRGETDPGPRRPVNSSPQGLFAVMTGAARALPVPTPFLAIACGMAASTLAPRRGGGYIPRGEPKECFNRKGVLLTSVLRDGRGRLCGRRL